MNCHPNERNMFSSAPYTQARTHSHTHALGRAQTLDVIWRSGDLNSSTYIAFVCLPLDATQVFQRRLNGSVDFFRGWTDYKNGFGAVNGEFWLGNDNINSLTSNGSHVLRIDMETFGGEKAFVEYTGFSIDAESTHYALRIYAYLETSTAGEFKCLYGYLEESPKNANKSYEYIIYQLYKPDMVRQINCGVGYCQTFCMAI